MRVRFAVKTTFLMFALSLSVYAQFTQTAYSQPNSPADEIRKTMDEIENAFVSRTPGPFMNYYIDGYVNIREKPVYNYREQLSAMVRWDAAAIKSGKTLSFETLAYNSEPPSIRPYGDAAIVNTLKKNLWRYKDDRCLTRYQTTELWVKNEGVWKIAAAHMSTLQCDPMPWQPPHPALSDIRPQSKPTKFLSTTVETELRELLSKLNASGLRSDTNTDAFTSDFISTDTSSSLSTDRSGLLSALKIPTMRNRDRYRDDEVFLSFGPAAIYLFRIRSFPKAGETVPQPPIVFSVMFVKAGADWQIAASHASELAD